MLKILLNNTNKLDIIKCGEIFCHAASTYKVTCFFCGEQVLFEAFLKHFQELHISDELVENQQQMYPNISNEASLVKDENIKTEYNDTLIKESLEDMDEEVDGEKLINIEELSNTQPAVLGEEFSSENVRNESTGFGNTTVNNWNSDSDKESDYNINTFDNKIEIKKPKVSTKKSHMNKEEDNGLDFACKFCSRTYKRLINLNRHISAQHKDSKDILNKHSLDVLDGKQNLSQRISNECNMLKHEEVNEEINNTSIKKSLDKVEEFDDEKPINIEYFQDSDLVKSEEGDKLMSADDNESNDLNESTDDGKVDGETAKEKLKRFIKNSERRNDENSEGYHCKLCTRTYKRLTYFNQHIRLNHKDSKEVLDKEGKSTIQVEELPFQCTQCPRSYRHKKSLLGHVRMHHSSLGSLPQKIYKCDECGESFRNERFLQTHKFRHKGLTCDICGKKFSQVGNLQLHIKRHSGVKEFKCEECGKLFFTDHERINHMVKHTQHFPSICEICGKPCRDGKLKSHMRRHTGERPAKCEVCGKCFFDTHDLNVHATSHSNERPFPCDICGSAFRHKKALRVHKKIHNKDRNYKCKICDKTYAQVGGLTSHMRSHYTSVHENTSESSNSIILTDVVMPN